jgi:hypothetical protein
MQFPRFLAATGRECDRPAVLSGLAPSSFLMDTEFFRSVRGVRLVELFGQHTYFFIGVVKFSSSPQTWRITPFQLSVTACPLTRSHPPCPQALMRCADAVSLMCYIVRHPPSYCQCEKLSRVAGLWSRVCVCVCVWAGPFMQSPNDRLTQSLKWSSY